MSALLVRGQQLSFCKQVGMGEGALSHLPECSRAQERGLCVIGGPGGVKGEVGEAGVKGWWWWWELRAPGEGEGKLAQASSPSH